MKQLKGLTDKILALDGQPILDGPAAVTCQFCGRESQAESKPLLVKEVIANSLARGTSADAVRAMDVALKFYHATSRLVLDDADIGLAVTCITADRFYTDLARVPALKVLSDATEMEPNRAEKRRAKKGSA